MGGAATLNRSGLCAFSSSEVNAMTIDKIRTALRMASSFRLLYRTKLRRNQAALIGLSLPWRVVTLPPRRVDPPGAALRPGDFELNASIGSILFRPAGDITQHILVA